MLLWGIEFAMKTFATSARCHKMDPEEPDKRDDRLKSQKMENRYTSGLQNVAAKIGHKRHTRTGILDKIL